MDYNVLTADFAGKNRICMTDTLYQYDYGQKLKIENVQALPQTFEAHFSNVQHGGVSITITGMDGIVDIPNTLLMTGKRIYCWIYVTEPGSGETEYQILLPVQARPMPEYYDVTDVGVFDSVVQQVGDYAATATAGATSATASAAAAATSASEAAASASAAETAKTAAKTAQGKAENAQTAAETAAQTATEKAQQTAQDAAQAAQSKADAESAAQRAEAAQTGAESAKTAAETAAQGAAASASAASASATGAGQAATSAGQSATAAAGSATTASTAARTATTKASEASASATAAAASETAAQTAQTAAETAETNAGQSASTATTKAGEAARSASSAAQSKTAAEAAATRAEQAAATLTVDDALSDTSTNPVENRVITAEVTQVKNAIDALKITDTASGAIASFPDGSANPVKSLTVEMNPVQDLHGQDSPYPAGGGKNLLEVTATTQTINGVTFTVNSDGTVLANGTAIAITSLTLSTPGITLAENAILNGCPSGGGGNTYALQLNGLSLESGSGLTISANTEIASVRIRIASGAVLSNVLFKPMIRLASVSDATFAPYSNICPISGRESVTVERTGVNVWDEEWELGTYSLTDGTPAPSNYSVRGKNRISCKPNTEYYCNNQYFRLLFYDASDSFISYTVGNGAKTTPANCAYMRFYMGDAYGTTYNHDISINYPSTDHDYHAYDGQSVTVQLGQTVYGGTVDVTDGWCDDAYGRVDLGTLNWTYISSDAYTTGFYAFMTSGIKTGVSELQKAPIMCDTYGHGGIAWPRISDFEIGVNANASGSTNQVIIKDSRYTDAAAFKASLSGVYAVYERATPQTIPLTPAQLTTLKGDNNVWSDADSVSVEYVADPKLYIDKKITAAVAALA